MSLYNQFPNPLDPLIAKVAYDSFNQIYKTMQSTKKGSIAAVMQYYEDLNTKYRDMLNKGEVIITLNSRHDYLNPNHDTKKVLFKEKFNELRDHKIAQILGIKEEVENIKGTYPKKIKISLNKYTLALLKNEAPGICREYETFLEKKKTSLKNKIRILDNIKSTIDKLNQAVARNKKIAADYISNNLNEYISYYEKYKNAHSSDKDIALKNGQLILPATKLGEATLISVSQKDMDSLSSDKRKQYIGLQKKFIARIEKAEKRVDRIIMILEKIDSYINRKSNKPHKTRPN